MNIELLSKTYTIRKLGTSDAAETLELCQGNPQYYQYCPPTASVDTIKKDMTALPPNKTLEDKYYIGFYEDKELVAVMDLILGFPNKETAFIGFFMMNNRLQGKGIGSAIVKEACAHLSEDFSAVRLGYVKGNSQSENFWLKNHFQKTGVEAKTDDYIIVMMEREL